MTRFIFFVLFLGFLFASPAAAQASRPRTPKGMVLVPKGDLRMGTDSSDIGRLMTLYGVKHGDLFTGEVPRHLVKLDAFYMDRYEVSNRDFALFLKKKPTWHKDSMPPKYDNGKYLALWKNGRYPTGTGNLPVTNVNWYAAVAYCHWVRKRLPTEAEWEYAARGGLIGVEFPWGDELADPSRANYGKSGFGKPVKIGSYPPNGYGLYDMAGNVWEFTLDEWGKYNANDQQDPIAGGNLFADDSFYSVTTRRVIRGGSWGGSPINLRAAYRDSHPPTGSESFVGFRCVIPAKEVQ